MATLWRFESSSGHSLSIIRAVVRKARIEWKWTSNNPLEGFKAPKQPKDRRRRISDDEIERIVLAPCTDLDLRHGRCLRTHVC